MSSYKNPRLLDDSGWSHSFARLNSPSGAVPSNNSSSYVFRIHYVDIPAYNTSLSEERALQTVKGTILLIHGFPQTWYQYREIINPLSAAGYRVIVPDYRGAGNSQAPPSNSGTTGGKGGGYTKAIMADDLHTVVVDHLGLKGQKIHVVGHDIGAMVAHAYATRFANDTASLVYIDCPLPGSRFYDAINNTPDVWHFAFHNVEDDLPERLVQGHERTYMRHFFDRLAVNPWFIPPGSEVEDVYVGAYTRPGAFRAAFDTYRAFDQDAKENQEWRSQHGLCNVPALSVSGSASFNDKRGKEQLEEFYTRVDATSVVGVAHWVVEEAPEKFVDILLPWLEKRGSGHIARVSAKL